MIIICGESAASDMLQKLRGLMYHSAGEWHSHCQALCTALLHNSSPWGEYYTCVVLMVYICHYIPAAKYGQYPSKVTHLLGDGQCVLLHQCGRGSISALRADHNAWVFLTETRVVAGGAKCSIAEQPIN